MSKEVSGQSKFNASTAARTSVKAVAWMSGLAIIPGLFRFVRDDLKQLRNNAITLRKHLRQTTTKTTPESFDTAVQRLGLSATQLRQRYSQYQIQFWLFALLFAIAAIAGIICTSQAIFTGTVGAIGIAAAFLAKTIEASFRAWQIRHCNLGTFSTWLSSPSEWPPRSL